MPLTAAGLAFPNKDVSWTRRDALLFAVSIGCTEDEPHFLYELDADFQLFPTYAMMLPFKLGNTDVTDFYAERESTSIPSPPTLDSRRVVDAGRHITFLKPLPTASNGRCFRLRSTILGVYDKGHGTIVEKQDEIFDSVTGEVFTRAVGSDFFVGQGGWGGPRGAKPLAFDVPGGRLPEARVRVQTTRETAHLYRLNGDYNPLHGTPEPGVAMGFGGIIMHGLYAWNNAAHAVLKEFGGSRAENLCEFQARFLSPVRPGDGLVTDMWRMGPTADGMEEVRFITRISGGPVCLNNGRALLRSVIKHGLEVKARF